MKVRLNLRDNLEYEKFFFRYFTRMNREEKFEFEQIRAITEGPLRTGNAAILETLTKYPFVFDELPRLADLQQHLVFWLNKYDKVFVRTSEMCLLYVGVEDAVPFPSGLDQEVAMWLEIRGRRPKAALRKAVRISPGGRSRTLDELQRYPLPVKYSDDTQKSRWGGKSTADGRRLTAHVVRLGKKRYEVTLCVTSTDGSSLQGPVLFHLHKGPDGAFPRSPISIRRCTPDAVLNELIAREPFTVGAEASRADGLRTVLELDLTNAFKKADTLAKAISK
jgi:hypothetical protein